MGSLNLIMSFVLITYELEFMSWICDFPLTRESKKTETHVSYLMDINRCWPLIHSQEGHQQWPRSPSCFSPHIIYLPQNQVYPSHLQFPSSHIKHVPPCLLVPSDFPYNCLFCHCWNWSARTQFSHVDSQHTYCVVSLPFATQKRLHWTSPPWCSDIENVQISPFFGYSYSSCNDTFELVEKLHKYLSMRHVTSTLEFPTIDLSLCWMQESCIGMTSPTISNGALNDRLVPSNLAYSLTCIIWSKWILTKSK